MRTITSLNADWQFSKDDKTFEHVNLPHTWNNFDGQDGEGDYLRQKCFYKKELAVTKSDKKVFIEFEGANHIANVYFNGTHLGEHRGGFSTFRFELTDYIGEKNLLEVHVDNSEEIPVYPQQADFTFFGGLYRNVNLIEVPQTHFDLDFYGSQGIYITPTVKNNAATIDVLAYTKGESGKEVVFTVCDADGKEVAQAKSHTAQEVKVSMSIENPVLWNGVKNPYLYTLRSEITDGESGTDTVSISFGIRSFSVDNDKGFILNGTECPLHGVSRHQDKLDKGWALLPEDHETDIAIIKEMGANTIRLAHYQHCQYFYDLCDKDGFVVWAEIPFITMFMSEKEAQENTVSQMKELVLQNYNHPSICFWGISNEITIGGENDALVENQKTLVNVIKQYDTTRLTTIANVSFVPPESSQNQLTDIIGYNHYFGWYGGELTQNEEWIDEFHKNYPTRPLCISEYGAEGILKWHTDTPQCRDYTEEYHAVYHEHMLHIFESRPFLWATYQWNMFDFAANARDEGGVKGRNNKGLVTYDRKTKKDAFYLYKAYWNTNEDFVHVAGRRYVDRAGQTTNITVYSNEEEVTLTVNGNEVATLKAHKVFNFQNVELAMGNNTVAAKTAHSYDEITVNRVSEPNADYILPQSEDDADSDGAKNWFTELQEEEAGTELTFNEGYFSIKDTLGDIMKHPEAYELMTKLMSSTSGNMKLSKGMLKMIGGMQLEVILQMAGKKAPPNAKYLVNAKLQKIKK